MLGWVRIGGSASPCAWPRSKRRRNGFSASRLWPTKIHPPIANGGRAALPAGRYRLTHYRATGLQYCAGLSEQDQRLVMQMVKAGGGINSINAYCTRN